MIAHVPGQKGNRRVDIPVALEDVAPTLAALAQQKVPSEMRSQWTGKSLVPLLQDRLADLKKRPIFIHEPNYRGDPLTEGAPNISPNSVMIEGDYKLIGYHDGTMRLYDIPKDISEQNDLSASMPERVERMKKTLAQWRFENVPARYDTRANPRYDPESALALPRPDGPLFVR